MAGISIPGVTDKYNTNETVEKLMQIERIPLTREQQTLETYKKQQVLALRSELHVKEITTSSLELLDRLDLNTNSGSLSSFLQIYVLHSEFVTAVSTTTALLLALSLHSV